MNYLDYRLSNKPLAAMAMGTARLPDRETTAKIIRACVELGVLYIDTAPLYRYESKEENAERWVGEAIAGLRDKVILSAKCSPGDGWEGVGEFSPTRGQSVTTADNFWHMVEQSLTYLQVDHFDCYQLWAIHSPLQFETAFRKGGWMEAAMRAKEQGVFHHLGITGHGKSAEIRRWIDTGCFEMITIPFHILDLSRLEAVRYAHEKGMPVAAMNPLGGGLLGTESPEIARAMADVGATSTADLALRFVTAFPGVAALCGLSSVPQVAANAASLSKPRWSEARRDEIARRMGGLRARAGRMCTSCGYCLPCDQGIPIPDIFRLHNCAQVLGLEAARAELTGLLQFLRSYDRSPDRCTDCGACEKRCPDGLPIRALLAEVLATSC
jgi:uncharacterized protein